MWIINQTQYSKLTVSDHSLSFTVGHTLEAACVVVYEGGNPT